MCFGILDGVGWWLVTDVSRQTAGPETSQATKHPKKIEHRLHRGGSLKSRLWGRYSSVPEENQVGIPFYVACYKNKTYSF
jgi:hypothetical protein